MLEDVLAVFSALCAFMASLAFFRPQRFSPCGRAYRGRRFLGALLWLSFASMLYGWRSVLYAHAVFGWGRVVAFAALAACALTALAVWNFLAVQEEDDE